MDLELTGRTAVVTGASRGIGLATVDALVAEGVHVVAAARTPVERDGVTSVAVDLTDPAAAATLADAAGDVDILVNNLGGAVATGGFLDIDDQAWQATFELNLFAPVRITRALLPGLLRRRGVVISVSSIGARAAYPGVEYGTAKAAVTNLGKALAEEFGPQGLRALTVTPGPTRTAIWTDPDGPVGRVAAAQGVPFEDFRAAAIQGMGLATGRLTEPAETAALITFLASPRAANLTGADYLADGGALKAV